jgi:hypothetical protein
MLPICAIAAVVVGLDALVEGRGRNLGAVVLRGLAFAAGTGLVVAAAELYYGLRWSTWAIYETTIAQASSATQSVLVDQTPTWLSWRQYLLVAPLALLLAALAHRQAVDDPVRRSIRRLGLVVGASLAVFAYFQWIREDPLLSIYYYSCVPLSLAVFLMARSAASLISRRPPLVQALCTASLVAAFAAAALLGREWKPPYAVLAVGLVAATAVTASAWRATATRTAQVLPALGLVGLVAFAGFASTSSPHTFPPASTGFKADPLYDTSLFSYDQSLSDVYRLAHDYANFVPEEGTEPGPFRVWFRRFDPGWANQVQATLIHGTSALQGFPNNGLPELTEFEPRRVQEERLRYVIVVDSDAEIVRQGVDELLGAGLPFEEIRTRTFSHGTAHVTVSVLRRKGPA